MLKQPKLADILSYTACNNSNEISTTDDYEALTPSIIEPRESAVYTDALNFACSRWDIRNIAVTGAYGAGKSSVLRTWKECPDNDLRIMTISLADFEMQSAPQKKPEPAGEEGKTSSADDKKAAAEEKTIEYSILQQLLYKEKKSALPYSRIERISDITSFQVAAVAADLLVIMGVIVAGLLCLFPDYVSNKLSLPEMMSHQLSSMPAVRLAMAGLLIFTALFLSVKKLHRIGLFDRRVSVDKVDMLKGAISTRPSSPSLLNVYIDEIVYFFEQTGHNVVIFEDLDRHNDGAIFIKLREINQIINNTRPDDDPVRFIYAVRDGLFSTAEARTKFFDFVIPVITVMDSENAAEHFISMFRGNEISEPGFNKCVSRLALFIPDMRIMRNIANEFRIYQNLVNGAGDITRLLSMIAYKNLFSEDYHGIDLKKGVLYSFVRAFVSGELKEQPEKELRVKMLDIQSEIDALLNDKAVSAAEIRRDILSDYISPKQEGRFKFHFGSESYYLNEIAQDEDAFNKLRNVSAIYVWSQEIMLAAFTIQKGSIQEIVESFDERMANLDKKNQGKVSQLQEDINAIEGEINTLNQTSLAALTRNMGRNRFFIWAEISFNSDNSITENNEKRIDHLDFIYFLLIHSYIASDYMFYRSVFRPGSLSHEDNEFIKAVSIGRMVTDTLDMPLRRVENVIAKLSSLGLMMEDSAWHSEILLYLLGHEPLKLQPIIKVQSGDDWCLVRLAEHTFKKWSTSQRIRYVELIASDKEKAFTFVRRLSEMEQKAVASELLLLHLCSSGPKWNHDSTDMKQWAQSILASNGLFPDQVPEGYCKTFKTNLINTNLNDLRLDVCDTACGKEIVATIVENQRWGYSAANLNNIILMLTVRDEKKLDYLYKEPVSAVEALNIPEIKAVVWENINSFIVDYFIASQEHRRITELLNMNSINAKTCFEIVTKMQFIVDDISQIKNRLVMFEGAETKKEGNDLYSLLLEYHRITTNWDQLGFLLKQEDISDTNLSKWFDENAGTFEDTYVNSSSIDLIDLLIQRVFNSPALNDASRNKILANLHVTFLVLPENLDLEKVALLIEYGRLAPTDEIFRNINDTFINDGRKVTETLVKFVVKFPVLLRNWPDLVLKVEDDFDRPLAEMLFSSEDVSEADLVNALNWLWKKEPEIFSGSLFIAAGSLTRLAPDLSDDNLRLQLITQCLKEASLSDEDITVILKSFSDDDYHSFISDKSHRSLKHNDPLWQLALLLDKAGFIRSLSWNEALDRIWFIPHNSPVFRRG